MIHPSTGKWQILDGLGKDVRMESAVDRRNLRRLRQQDLSRTHLLDAAEEIFGSRGFAMATCSFPAKRTSSKLSGCVAGRNSCRG
jgi:hypothetical protein